MPTWTTLAAFAAELDAFERDLTGPEKKGITRLMGVEAKHIADGHVKRSLGAKRAFSGWNRGHPIPLGTHLKPARDFNALLLPTFPGGWTVGEFGRHAGGGAGGFQGPGVNRRTGRTTRTKSGAIRGVRVQAARRWNGVTQGKHIASRAAVDMERQLPRIADKAVLKVSRKRFTVT